MNVNSVGHSFHSGYAPNNGGIRAGQARPAEAPTPPVEEEVLVQPQEAPVPSQTEDDAAGVLRLLQEGHFKGVADVRLRINFHEQLAAMQSAAAVSAGKESLDEMAASVRAGVEALGAPQSPEQQQSLTEAQVAFDQALAAAAEALTAGQEAGGVKADLQTAFDSLTAVLEPIFAPPAPPEEPVDPPVQETVSPLEALRAAFATALESFAESLEPVQTLPEPSPPSGNGKAYDKFLAIYTSLQTPAQLAETETVDVQA